MTSRGIIHATRAAEPAAVANGLGSVKTGWVRHGVAWRGGWWVAGYVTSASAASPLPPRPTTPPMHAYCRLSHACLRFSSTFIGRRTPIHHPDEVFILP